VQQPPEHLNEAINESSLNHSYDYISGEFSEYSFISVSKEPPAEVKEILLAPLLPSTDEKEIKKSTLDSLCESASKALRSIKKTMSMDEPENFCRKIA
jgi:hypothetical protein